MSVLVSVLVVAADVFDVDLGCADGVPGIPDFGRLFAILDELGYIGHVGLEYEPTARTEATLSSLALWR